MMHTNAGEDVGGAERSHEERTREFGIGKIAMYAVPFRSATVAMACIVKGGERKRWYGFNPNALTSVILQTQFSHPVSLSYIYLYRKVLIHTEKLLNSIGIKS